MRYDKNAKNESLCEIVYRSAFHCRSIWVDFIIRYFLSFCSRVLEKQHNIIERKCTLESGHLRLNTLGPTAFCCVTLDKLLKMCEPLCKKGVMIPSLGNLWGLNVIIYVNALVAVEHMLS